MNRNWSEYLLILLVSIGFSYLFSARFARENRARLKFYVDSKFTELG